MVVYIILDGGVYDLYRTLILWIRMLLVGSDSRLKFKYQVRSGFEIVINCRVSSDHS